MTVREAIADGSARLAAAGVDSPRLDTELLLAHALGKDRTYVAAHLSDALAEPAASEFQALLQRRASREPLPYLLGRWEWLGMSFHVSPAVLIPRPETEVLVETVAARSRPEASILEVGTGSGCIAVGLARLLPQATVTTIEPSAEARGVAQRNLRELGVADRVRVIPGAFPKAAAGLGPFDAMVSNPPYIASDEVDGLEPEVRNHEPRLALDGGPDGLSVLRPLAEGLWLLVPGGLLALEVAQNQAERVLGLLGQHGWRHPEVVPDLSGVPRVVLARTPSRG